MGKSLLIILIGFAASFGFLANSKNRRYVDSVEREVNQFSDYSANNTAMSGAYMALNKLYKNKTWRTGYNNVVLAGDTLAVTVVDNTTDSTLAARRIRISSTASNSNSTDLNQVLLFDGSFSDFAIWAKDTVINVATRDSLGNPDSTLLVYNAPFMPDIDYVTLSNEAAMQSHLKSGTPWTPSNGYPNGNFYYVGTTPNVTKVNGDMDVKGGRTIYGIFLIEGNVTLEGNSRVQGVLYLPNPTSAITYINGGGSPTDSQVTGGILTWGEVDGAGMHISVKYNSQYMKAFMGDYAPKDPPVHILTWQ